MAIKIKKNGKIENFILHSTDVRVLDLDGKFKSKNLEDVLREVSDTEHIYIGEVDETKEGVWIDDEEILDNEEDNGVVKRLEEYVDKKVDVVNSQMNEKANPNLLINGDFQVWQRGTSFNNSGYSADRWFVTSDKGISAVKNENGITIKNTEVGAWHNFETRIEVPSSLRGEKVTFSINFNNSYMYRQLYVHDRSNNKNILSKNVDSEVLSDSVSFIIPNNCSILTIGIQLQEVFNSEMNIKNAKLELGTVATPFVPRPYTEELALCQRYYQIIKNGIAYPLAFWFNSNLDFLIPLSTPMRKKPTISIPDGKSISVKNFDDNTVFTDAILIGASGDIGNGSSLNLRLSKTNNGVKNGACWCNGFDASFDAEIY